MAADVPMARCISTLCQTRKGTESVPPPMPTRLEMSPMTPPAAPMPQGPGSVLLARGRVPRSICTAT